MKLIAVSGGVDSILLAYKYRNKDVILAFVNYNVRKDTNIDEKNVTEFAKKYNLKLEKLILQNKYPKGNFENIAREIRYDFFLQIYKKYHCNELLIAHHKDDFLETCIMQEQKNKNKLFYGIKKITTFKGMKIRRPFINMYWKSQIYELAKKYNLNYNDDYTNYDPKYTRNKIRLELSNFSITNKEKEIDRFLQINNKNKSKIVSIKNEYKTWKNLKFSILEFDNFFYKEEIITMFINKRLDNINLNKNILFNITKFILSPKNKNSFLLTNNNFLVKKNNKLYINKTNL